MKKSTTGSILIWSIFLVVFISFSFMYISFQIKQSISENGYKLSDMSSKNLLNNYDFSSQSKDLGNNLSIELLNYSNFSGSLKKDEKNTFYFSGANSFGLSVGNGMLYFELYDTGGLLNTGVLNTGGSTNLSFTSNSGGLLLRNVGGLTNYYLTNISTPENIKFPYNYYKITKSIQNENFVQEFGEIK